MTDDKLKELDYYEAYEKRCSEADDDRLDDSFYHWAKCHTENVAAKRDDLILWSVHHLEIILREQRKRAVKRRKEGR